MKHFGHFILSSLISFATLSGAQASTVRATDLAAFTAFASNETLPTVSMVSEIPTTGVGEQKASPIKIYVPISNAPPTDQSNASTFANTSLLPRKKGNGLATVMFSITATNTDTSNSQILNVGVQDATDNKFETFIPSNTLAALTVTANSSKEINVLVNLDNICSQVSCVDVDTSTAEDQQDFKLFFFLDSSQNSNTEKEGDTNGLFVSLKFSSQIPDNTYTFSQLVKGDGRLFADLSNGQLITFMGDDIHKTLIFSYSNTTVQASETLGNAKNVIGGGVLELQAPVLNGVLKVTGLNNGEEYNLAFSTVNKYQFSSPLSVSLVQEPEDILALLQKQACYLVTAGFQREHPVLDRLRLFRDEQLLTTTLGRQFVNFYYRTAPLMAPYIIESPFLAWLIRMCAYLMVFTIVHFQAIIYFIAIGFGSAAAIYLIGRRTKIATAV